MENGQFDHFLLMVISSIREEIILLVLRKLIFFDPLLIDRFPAHFRYAKD